MAGEPLLKLRRIGTSANRTGHPAAPVEDGFGNAAAKAAVDSRNKPGSGQGTLASNINLRGEIAGNYTDASGVSHGFVVPPPYTTFTSFDPTGSIDTFTATAIGINLEGAITGVYVDSSGVLHGYVRAANGTITDYNVTGAGTAAGQGTSTSGINDLGAIIRTLH